MLFDFKNIIDGNPTKSDALTYEALLSASVKDWDKMDEDKRQHYFSQCISKFSILNHSYMCDGKKNYPHYSPIKKLSFILR